MEPSDVIALAALVTTLGLNTWQSRKNSRARDEFRHDAIVRGLQGEDASAYLAFLLSDNAQWMGTPAREREEMISALATAYLTNSSDRVKALVFSALDHAEPAEIERVFGRMRVQLSEYETYVLPVNRLKDGDEVEKYLVYLDALETGILDRGPNPTAR
jgi:hypothetical protein